MTDMRDVFIVGSKGIPARYGGFETFVEQLTAGRQSPLIRYHVSCMSNEENEYVHNGANCFNVRLPLPGAVGRICHVSLALSRVERHIEDHGCHDAVVLVLGCRIGPLLHWHAERLHKLGAVVWVNPDGLEWKRDKWNAAEKRFLKYCEACLIENADLVICDSRSIMKYVKSVYDVPEKRTCYIAYGANTEQRPAEHEKTCDWYKKHGIEEGSYYLVVGRFVPENNYETIIREYMKSGTSRDLVIITNSEKNRFYENLRKTTGFDGDARIKFVGTVYDADLLKNIRSNAFAYIHGHSVGGTNPSLLEAMATTPLNLLYDVEFNREVAEDAALYWSTDEDSLSETVYQCEKMGEAERESRRRHTKERIAFSYTWEKIITQYETLLISR